MAATLTLLKLPLVPKNPLRSSFLKLLNYSIFAKFTIPPQQDFDLPNPLKLLDQNSDNLRSASLSLSAITLPFLIHPKDAIAVGGEFGILEGRTFALIHPIVMVAFFFYTLWARYLGWQWRRVRTIQNEINELKKQVKPTPMTPYGNPVEAPSSPVELKIQQLTEVTYLLEGMVWNEDERDMVVVVMGARAFDYLVNHSISNENLLMAVVTDGNLQKKLSDLMECPNVCNFTWNYAIFWQISQSKSSEQVLG